MKKLIILVVFSFAAMSFTQNDIYKIENVISPNKEMELLQVDPENCWAGADAAESFVCGSVGCNYQLWDAVYSACMGWD